jgi:1,2-diacylglycerol 3-beta-galactosyltransferase
LVKVLILDSQTGVGHRAASDAIKAALLLREPNLEIEIVDGLVLGGPWPLNRAPAIYSWCMRYARWAWAFVFHLWNGPFRAKVMADLGYPGTVRRLRKLLQSKPADIMVSTHPLLTRTVARVMRGLPPKVPFAIVVTDLVTGHWSWYDRGADRIFVPTPEAFDIVRKGGVDPLVLRMTGQAVHPRCGQAVPERDAIRTRHHWTETVVLIVGGGEGMGAIYDHAAAINEARLDIRLVVVCGRNEKQRTKLEAIPVNQPTEILGFVNNLHELMAAADILVTKSGPGSIMEGCVAGLPILLYDYLPGQEVGNVRLVEARGIGHYVPKPKEVVAALKNWLDNPESMAAAALASREYAIPDSADRIATGILELLPKSESNPTQA